MKIKSPHSFYFLLCQNIKKGGKGKKSLEEAKEESEKGDEAMVEEDVSTKKPCMKQGN